MPGPKKVQAQRTKGNVKPSNSTQAAQLLASSGHSPLGFIGFSNQPAFVPASETFDDVDSTLDSDFRLVLRKFSKKDTVTKIKALQEFDALCASKDDDCIKAIVPFWPRIYNKVAIDFEFKVRELSQKSMATLASRAGKHLAPHLKSLMGTWLVCMCDVYPTVSTAAKAAFKNTFPPKKQTDAIVFCQTDILECLVENILVQTPYTLSDPLTTSEEDMQTKYKRVVTSSLHAFKKMAFLLPNDTAETTLSPFVTKLLTSSGFWKHSKSDEFMIKSGVLSVVSSACQVTPSVSAKYISKTSPFVFSCLNSTNHKMAPNVWEALLSLINAHEDCWEHVSWQKAVWPKLKSLLENGCDGEAAIISNCFLPLLSKMPQANRNFAQFFSSYRLGLSKEAVLNAPSDANLLVQGFMECMHYSIRDLGETGGKAFLVQDLLMDELLLVVEASLTDDKAALAKSCLYSRLANLLSFVEQTHPEASKTFWEELSSFIRSHLLAEVKAKTSAPQTPLAGRQLFQRLKLLIQGLVFQEHSSTGRKERVKFQTDQDICINLAGKEKKQLCDNAENLICGLLVTSFSLAVLFKDENVMGLFKDMVAIHIPKSAPEKLNLDVDMLKQSLTDELGELIPQVSDPNQVERTCVGDTVSGQSTPTEPNVHTKAFLSKLLDFLQTIQGNGCVNSNLTDHVVESFFAFLENSETDNAHDFICRLLEIASVPCVICQVIKQIMEHNTSLTACNHIMKGAAVGAKVEQMMMLITSKMDNLTSQEEVKEDKDMDEDVIGAVWQMLEAAVSSLSRDFVGQVPWAEAVIKSCVVTLQKVYEETLVLKLENLSSFLCLVDALLHKEVTQDTLDLVFNSLPLLLSAKYPKDSSVHEILETSWMSTIRHLMSSSLSHDQIHSICTFICDWVCREVRSKDGLDAVSDAVEKMVHIASEVINSDEHEIPEEERTREFDDIMGELFIKEQGHVDYSEELTNYMYMTMDLLSPRQQMSDKAGKNIPLSALVFIALHNMRVVKLVESHFYEDCSFSDEQLDYLVSLANHFIMLHTAKVLNVEAVKEYIENVEELKSETLELFSTLTMNQTLRVVTKSQERKQATYASGVCKVICQLELSDIEPESRKGLRIAKERLWNGFITRCLRSQGLENTREFAEIQSRLEGPSLTMEEQLDMYVKLSNLLIACGSAKISDMTECVIGFAKLLSKVSSGPFIGFGFFRQTMVVIDWCNDQGAPLLTGSDASADRHVGDDVVELNSSLARIFSLIVTDAMWEVCLCSLIEWIQYLVEVEVSMSSSLTLQGLASSIFKLAQHVACTFTIKTVDDEEAGDDPANFTMTLKSMTEWKEFFSEGVFSALMPLYARLGTECLSQPDICNSPWCFVLSTLAVAISRCPQVLVPKLKLPPKLTATDTSFLSDHFKSFLNHILPILMAREEDVAVASFYLLQVVIKDIAKSVAESNPEATAEEEEQEISSPPEAMIHQMEAGVHVLEYFKDVNLQEEVLLEKGTQEYAWARGYLLTWKILLRIFHEFPNELRAKYAQFFKANSYVNHLLDILFRLIPVTPSLGMLVFCHTPAEADTQDRSKELAYLSMNIYRQCLEILPALVRQWWIDLDRTSSNFIDRFTTQYMSSRLCMKQLDSSEITGIGVEGIDIRSRPAVREVLAVYKVEEVTVNMTITLPENYPLGKVKVSSDKCVGVSRAQWERWLLQLNIFLQHQNGTIADGLRVWKKNVDNKFEGIDECMVCFSVIHNTTFQLPRLTCRTCRKKFHSSCLYKWFSTSQKSTCPLCRNMFTRSWRS